MKERKSIMKKYLAICSMLALVSASQATVIFQEDYSGYAAAGPLVAPQVGTWIQNGGTINIATYHTLLDGTVGPCMEFVDDSASFPTLSANFISYTASPIRITYDFLMRRTAIDNQDFSVMTEAANEGVTYYKTSDANSTQDWIQLRDNGDANSITTYYARDSWYTMEMELPVMPASGQFTMKYTIHDAAGNLVYTKDMLSWSASAGADLVDELLFRGGWGGAHQSSMLLDNILVETIPEPATLGMFGVAGLFTLLMRRIRM